MYVYGHTTYKVRHMGSQSWQVPVPAVPSQRAPEEVHSESSIVVSNGLKTPDLSLRSMTLGEYPRIFHSSQKRLVFPLTDPQLRALQVNTGVKDPSPLETYPSTNARRWLTRPASAVTQLAFIPILSLALTRPQRYLHALPWEGRPQGEVEALSTSLQKQL